MSIITTKTTSHTNHGMSRKSGNTKQHQRFEREKNGSSARRLLHNFLDHQSTHAQHVDSSQPCLSQSLYTIQQIYSGNHSASSSLNGLPLLSLASKLSSLLLFKQTNRPEVFAAETSCRYFLPRRQIQRSNRGPPSRSLLEIMMCLGRSNHL